MVRKEHRVIKVGRHTLELTNESKILFPKDRISKGDLIAYYHDIAPIMVPYTYQRPLTMQRFPEGITHEGFYQKDASDYFPSWIKTVPVKKESGGTVRYVLCNNAATLVYLANQASIPMHLWLSKADKLNYPDRIIFDLDPSGSDFSKVRSAALAFKKLLEQLGAHPFVMTTGSRGLHVVIPIKRTQPFDVVKSFAREVAAYMVLQDPDHLTIELRKEKRKGRILIDYFRNELAQTAIAPYAVRALNGAPVATPLAWDEVHNKKLSSQQYTIKTIKRRVAKIGDPWEGMHKHAVSVIALRKRLEQLQK